MILIICLFVQTIDQRAIDKALDYARQVHNQPVTCGIVNTNTGSFTGAMRQYYTGPCFSIGGRTDIIVGDEPSETLYVSGYFYNNGNITVINDGVVKIDHADFYLDGNIVVMDYGEVYVDSSVFTILQHYIYHRILTTVDSATFSITNTTTSFNGYQVNINVQAYGQFIMDNVINNDWITAVVMHNASAVLDHVDYTGEWLFINECTATFNHVDYLLTWYFCEDSSVIDFTFPSNDTVYGFVFDSTLANVTNIDYHVEIDSSTSCLWAAIPLRGSDVTIRDSQLRVTGLMFNGVDTFAISGLVNGLHYNDYVLPVQDRIYHLINTSVQTWNLYPADSTQVNLTSSIFGELCGFSSSYSVIQQAFCDGSGGHIEASSTATVLVLLSSVFADVITKDHGICLLAHCSMPYGRIWATGSSIMIIVNTQFPEDPIPSDTSIVFVAAVTGPSEAMVDDTVGIIGSAWIDIGPYQPLDFDYFRLHYRLVGDSVWLPIGGSQTHEVRRDTLVYWVANGLSSGDYEVRLVLKDTAGDSVEALKQIRLRPTGINESMVSAREPVLSCKRLQSLVFKITCTVDRPEIRIYDISGQQVALFHDSEVHWYAPACGIYFVREKTSQQTRKVVVF